MTTFPLNVIAEYGTGLGYLIYAVLGFWFGFILESAGFGNSRKLAAQFYFTELTVFKVMFTAIVVAMVLVFIASGIGLLDYNLIWVNPTYLWPGIIGGFVMGVGFIIGGFCPGTSLVALATLKIDGMFFVAGALFGIFVFGDTVDFYNIFFNSSNLGRVTLPELFNMSYGAVVLLIVLMALLLFVGANWLENFMSNNSFPKPAKWQLPAAGGLALLALATLLIGQPNLEQRWQWLAKEEQARIDNREIYASPLEVATLQNDRKLKVNLLDIRDQSDFNFFHIRDAKFTSTSDLPALAANIIEQPANTVTIIAANGEHKATEVWKLLRAASVPNIYVLEGGINGWLRQFGGSQYSGHWLQDNETGDTAAFDFENALGDRYPMASPNLAAFTTEFDRKVKLEVKRAPVGGGCG